MNPTIALINLWMVFLFLCAISYMVAAANPFFSAVMQMLIALIAAQNFVSAIQSSQSTILSPLMGGAYYKLLYALVGFMMFASLFTKWRWIARYPTSILVGVGTGLMVRNVMITDVFSQVQSSILPIFTPNYTNNFSNLFFVIALILSLFYFTFGMQLKGPLVKVNKATRFLVLFGIGSQLGLTFFQNVLLGFGSLYQEKQYILDFFAALK